MRVVRGGLTGAIVMALSLGLTTTIVAQAEDELIAPAAYVTGAASSEDAVWEDPVGEGGSEWEMEWSDPRLPSRMHFLHDQVGGYATHPEGEAMAMQMASAVRLEGPDGDWVGTGWALAWMWGSEEEHEEDWVELLALDGEGGYEGLSATLTSTGHGGVPGPYEGFIFEGDLPKWPDPPKPPAD